MNLANNYPLRVLSIGVLCLIFFSIPLFWAMEACESILWDIAMPGLSRDSLKITPSGLVPELDKKPEVTTQSCVVVDFEKEISFAGRGITSYIPARYPSPDGSNLYSWGINQEGRIKAIYFDKKLGLMVYYNTFPPKKDDKKEITHSVYTYAGPEGVSTTPDEDLGRFTELIGSRFNIFSRTVVYDKTQSRFYKIDFDRKQVSKGPELTPDSNIKPFGMLLYKSSRQGFGTLWKPPMVKKYVKDMSVRRSDRKYYDPNEIKGLDPDVKLNSVEVPINKGFRRRSFTNFLLVLDQSGTIYKLDLEKLELTDTLGRLPYPYRRRGKSDGYTTDDLFAYHVLPVFHKDQYKGLVAASLSRDALIASLDVYGFEKETVQINEEFIESTTLCHQAAEEISFLDKASDQPGGPLMFVMRYLLENLQSPIFSLASFFTADSFEAAAGHRALFILPNSFVAMPARYGHDRFIGRFFLALLIISPSILLSVFLAWRVGRNATAIGLSRPARRYWIIGVYCLSLPAYITYRLTCPKIRMVTCPNCGNLRRPDMQICHHCNSPWHIPELAPPTWRVLD